MTVLYWIVLVWSIDAIISVHGFEKFLEQRERTATTASYIVIALLAPCIAPLLVFSIVAKSLRSK